MSTIITNVDLGRQLTESEKIAREAYIQDQVAAETTNGFSAGLYNGTAGIRVWNTTDAANAYIAWANVNYNPAPISAVVQTI